MKYNIDKELQKLRYMNSMENPIFSPFENGLVSLLYILKRPVDGIEMKHIRIPSRDGYLIHCDIFTPKVEKIEGAMIYYHGGGFLMGATHMHKLLVMKMALRTNQIVFMVHYRLSTKYPFPTPFFDTVDSAIYLREHAKEFNLSEDMFAVGGDSAGGNLSAALSLYLSDHELLPMRYQMLLYPALDENPNTESKLKYTDTPVLRTKALIFIYKMLFRKGFAGLDHYAYPTKHKKIHNQPPTYIEYCEFDPLHDDGMIYSALLKENKQEVESHEVKGAVHGFDIVSNSEIAKRYFQKRVDFIEKQIKR